MNNTTRFFKALYGNCPDGWLTIWTMPDKKTHWFKASEYKKAAEMALLLAHIRQYDVYFGVGLRKEKQGPMQRGSVHDITAIPGIWMDIDVRGDAHKEKALPPNIDSALQVIDDFPAEASILVKSGYGLHAYWLFDQPWIIEDDKEREAAVKYLQEFQGTFINYASQYGWRLDNTSDLARVLRVPGTVNYKGEPKDVQIINRQAAAV